VACGDRAGKGRADVGGRAGVVGRGRASHPSSTRVSRGNQVVWSAGVLAHCTSYSYDFLSLRRASSFSTLRLTCAPRAVFAHAPSAPAPDTHKPSPSTARHHRAGSSRRTVAGRDDRWAAGAAAHPRRPAHGLAASTSSSPWGRRRSGPWSPAASSAPPPSGGSPSPAPRGPHRARSATGCTRWGSAAHQQQRPYPPTVSTPPFLPPPASPFHCPLLAGCPVSSACQCPLPPFPPSSLALPLPPAQRTLSRWRSRWWKRTRVYSSISIA
jgi:hypothetical protein